MKYNQLQRLNKITTKLFELYHKENVDPKGDRVCRALDIIYSAACNVGDLANEESREVNSK